MKNDLDDDEDLHDEVPPGGSVRVPIHLMDAVQLAVTRKFAKFVARDHQPHHGELTGEQRKLRQDTRTQYLAGLQDAWRPPKVAQNATFGKHDAKDNLSLAFTTPDDDPMRRRTAAYDEMVQRATNAWRTPHKDWAEPDMGSRPQELALRRRLRNEPDEPEADDAQGRRDAAWARYRDQLASAWKTNPNAATQIERQGERWRGGR
jgi:hypothetical protein